MLQINGFPILTVTDICFIVRRNGHESNLSVSRGVGVHPIPFFPKLCPNQLKDVRYSKQGSHLLWLTVAIWNIVGPWFSAVWSSLNHKIYNKVKLHEFLWLLDQSLLRTSIKCEITHFLPLIIPDNLKMCSLISVTIIKKPNEATLLLLPAT